MIITERIDMRGISFAIPPGYTVSERAEDGMLLNSENYTLRIDYIADETDARSVMYAWKRGANVVRECFPCGEGWRAIYGAGQEFYYCLTFNTKKRNGIVSLLITTTSPTRVLAAVRGKAFTELVNSIEL